MTPFVLPDAEAWQAEANAYVRERSGSLVIETDFSTAADFRLSANRFARAGYRIEVVVLAGREADSRQATLVRHARALELNVVTALPTPTSHARASRTAGDITVAAATVMSPPS
ncbi:zeta toxin family protein, partial [Streptomyces erythrochromogenes]|uniref:zeta toxin family protein n=1 Tax=Streptomyces erythrochromogenes TaxID=285574 RepID=UPI0036AF2411